MVSVMFPLADLPELQAWALQSHRTWISKVFLHDISTSGSAFCMYADKHKIGII